MNDEVVNIYPIVYEQIDGNNTILTAALKTKGAAGPSGMDANGWRRILASRNYGKIGEDLRTGLANMLKVLCRQTIDPLSNERNLEAFLACRLVPLDKDPGVRPIGVGEVMRRIFGKALISVIKGDIMKAAGSLQVCAGQQSGCEAAVHAMNAIFEEEETDAILLVDASNAFNSLNRVAFLHNIKSKCPALATYVENCYSRHSRLFVHGGMEIRSEEGTTQGDPLAMPTYAIGLLPLQQLLRDEIDSDQVKSVAFADDIAGAGKLQSLMIWWNAIARLGPILGYHPKASKSWLIVKDEKLDEAKTLFEGTEVKVTASGRKYLGGTIGTDEFKIEYIERLVSNWVNQIERLSEIGKSEPQVAYCAFVGGFIHKLTFHLRVLKDMNHLLLPIDTAIDTFFIPAITDGHRCSRVERKLLALPVRHGGLGIPIFSEIAGIEFQNSQTVSHDLTDRIFHQTKEFNGNDTKGKSKITKEKEERYKRILEELRLDMTPDQRRANDLTQIKGSSNWLTAKPLETEHFNLTKREFFDAISIRYRWQLKHLPSVCACGKKFNVEHALSCAKGGFVYQRHNEIRDTIATALNEVSNDVSIEPQLEPVTGEELPRGTIKEDGARADICARGFWTRGQRAFFDVRVFNPYAQRYSKTTLSSAFEMNEKEKKRQYNQRIIRVEAGSFTPLIFTTNGGAGREAQTFVRALAIALADKRGEMYSLTLNYLRTKLSFALTRSTVLCIRGSRAPKNNSPKLQDINITEAIGYI